MKAVSKPRSVAVGLLLILGFATSGCYGVQVNNDPNMVRGSGNIITEPRPVSDINEVVLSTSGELTIEQNGSESLMLEGEDNIVPLITTEVKGNRLTIRTKMGSSYSTTKQLNYRLSVKDLSYVCTTASGDITVGKVDGEVVTAEATSAGSIRIEQLSAQRYVVRVTASGSIVTSGKVEEQRANLSSAGSYDGSMLESKRAAATVSGSGSATLAVSESLEATVTSAGSILYTGDPAVTRHDSGSGSIVQVKR